MEENMNVVCLRDAEPKVIAEKAAEILENKKGKDIKILYVADTTDISDYFVLVNGNSNISLDFALFLC